MATALAEKVAIRRAKALQSLGIRHKQIEAGPAPPADGGATVPFIGDSTIKLEMSVFGAVMSFAVRKRYAAVNMRFDERPKLKTMRGHEFTLEEYRKLHTTGRQWVKAASGALSLWHRTVTYNFILVMCNTGLRPSEAKTLRWRDITLSKDRDGRDMVALLVQGKGKSRRRKFGNQELLRFTERCV